MIVTEKGVMKVTDKGLELTEIFSTSSIEDIKASTDADLIINNPKQVDVDTL